MPNDKQLVREIKNGSEAAMEVLIKRYYKQIYAFVYRNVNNKELAYDLTQEIFMKMIKNIKTYRGKGEFKSWLFTLAINHCRDYLKSSCYMRQQSIQTGLPENLSVDHNNVSYIFERNETRKKVKSAIELLPDFQKEAVLLRYYHDLKIKDIAQITGVNESTVKSRLKQGLQKLRNYLIRGEDSDKKRIGKK